MSNFSRNSFQETQNLLNDLRGIADPPQEEPKHYVSIRMQQGVPFVDADWNELEDIRRMELETILVRAIGNGVPTGSDGFRIMEATANTDNVMIKAGLLFLDGWLVWKRTLVVPKVCGCCWQLSYLGVAWSPLPSLSLCPSTFRHRRRQTQKTLCLRLHLCPGRRRRPQPPSFGL